MRKSLLTLTAALCLAGGAGAQVSENYYGHNYWQMSPNGRFLIEEVNGAIAILNRNTGETFTFIGDESSETMYSVGLGNSATNDGVVVGTALNIPSLYERDKVVNLPLLQGATSTFNLGSCITPDGSRAAGLSGVDGASFGADVTFAEPTVWTRQGDGSYKAQILPHPEKDFLGLPPQYITAVDISDNGKTIVGQIVDCTGFYITPIVYTEDASGNWSYSTPGTAYIYDADKVAKVPARPEEPAEANAENYQTDDEKAKYVADTQEYNDLASQAMAGLIDWSEVPPLPLPWDYVVEKRAQWVTDSTAYAAASEKYNEEYMAYLNAVSAAVTGGSFDLNAVRVSGNGRYCALTLSMQGATPMDAKTIQPVVIDLTDGSSVKAEAADMASSTVMNDGTMVAYSPSSSTTRQSYIVKAGATVPVLFSDWLAEKGHAKNLKFLNDNYVFSVEKVSYDETGEPVYETVDSLLTGSVCSNADGTIFVSHLLDAYSDAGTAYTSYLLDTNADALLGIDDAVTGETGASAAVLRREYYNLAGQRIAAPAKGVYLEKVVTAEGAKTYKRVR